MQSAPRRIGLAAVAGVALALAFEPTGLTALIPLAVAGFLLSVRDLPPGRAWLPGLVFGAGFFLVLLRWLLAVGWDAWLALAVAESLFFALLGAVSAALWRLRAAPVWLACAWLAVEVLRGGWPLGGMPWGRLGFGTADTPLADALPYAGADGLGLGLALLGALLAALAAALLERRPWRRRAAASLGLLALLSVPALAPWPATADRQVAVAAVQGNVPGDGSDILGDFRQVTANHLDATVALARDVAAGTRPRPAFVVWPENSTAVDPFTDPRINAQVTGAVAAIGTPLLLGALVDAGAEHVLNQGIVWDPVTGAGERYTKHHPVPFGEYVPWRGLLGDRFDQLRVVPRDMMAGTSTQPLEIAGIRVADTICYDIAYDDALFAQLRHGAQLVVVQTSNATFIHTSQIEQQFEITRLRAVETGRYVVVAATNGVSGIIAPDGTVVASAAPRTQAVLDEVVGLDSSITPAVRLGPWVGRAAWVVTLVGLALALVPYRRPRGTAAVEPTPLTGLSNSDRGNP